MSIQSAIFMMRDFKRVMDRPAHPGLTKWGLASTYARIRLLDDSATRGKLETKFFDFKINYLNKRNLFLLFQDIFLGRIYEMPIDNNTPVIVDCGSNIGISILFFKSLYPDSKILAFEPHPAFFKTLKENIDNNRLANVTARQEAVSDQAGTIDFFQNDSTNPGSLNMGIIQREDDAPRTTVDSVLLSEYLTDEIDLLKLDIEGAEENVLIDLQRSGKLRNVRYIACEFHHHIESGVDRLSKTLQILEDAGFGYQVSAYCDHPPPIGAYQDVMIYAFRKD